MLLFGEENFWNTSEKLLSASTVVHELTHYLQFTGTTFGLRTRLLMLSQAHGILTIVRRYYKGSPVLPLIKSFIWGQVFRQCSEEDLKLYWDAMAAQLWFYAELYGVLFETKLPLVDVNSEYPIQGGPFLHGTDYRITGRAILENYAAFNEALFLYHPSRWEAGGDILFPADSAAEDYTQLNDHFSGGRPWVAILSLVYFIVLNFKLENLPIDSFVMAERFNSLYRQRHHFGKYSGSDLLAHPKEVIADMCLVSGLSNPFDNLHAACAALSNELLHEKEVHVELDVIERVLGFAINRTQNFLLWPGQLSLLGSREDEHGPPIINVKYFDNANGSVEMHNVTEFSGEWFAKLENSLWQTGVLRDISFRDGIRCARAVLVGGCPCTDYSQGVPEFPSSCSNKVGCPFADWLLKHLGIDVTMLAQFEN
jgi:hypothetical protein